jgi:hypothetical protein
MKATTPASFLHGSKFIIHNHNDIRRHLYSSDNVVKMVNNEEEIKVFSRLSEYKVRSGIAQLEKLPAVGWATAV